MITRSALAGLALAFGAAAALAYAPDRPAGSTPLRVAVDDLSEAYRTADVARLERLVTSDYLHTNGGTAPVGRDGWLAWNRLRAERHASGAWTTDSYEVSELVIVDHGSSAVVGGRVRSSGVRDGQPWRSDLRFTSVWVLRHGAWMRAAFQDAAITPAP